MENIGIEIEIDWRDFDVFVLVVRLEDGNIPGGYYVSDGKPCRYHIQKVISDRNWEVDKEAFAKISAGKKGKRQSGMNSEVMMLDRVSAYKQVIESCVEQLVEERDNIFLD